MNSQIMAIFHVAATGRGTDTVALRYLDNTPLKQSIAMRAFKVNLWGKLKSLNWLKKRF